MSTSFISADAGSICGKRMKVAMPANRGISKPEIGRKVRDTSGDPGAIRLIDDLELLRRLAGPPRLEDIAKEVQQHLCRQEACDS
jgi:hypothetical protein